MYHQHVQIQCLLYRTTLQNYTYEELNSKKGANPLSIKIELLISRHYSIYRLPLEHISDPNITSIKKIL